MAETLIHIPHSDDSACKSEKSLVAQWIGSGVDIRFFPLLAKLETLGAVDLLSEPTRDLLRALDRALLNARKNYPQETREEFELVPLAQALGELAALLENPPWMLRKRLRAPTGPLPDEARIIERAAAVAVHVNCARFARIDYFP